MNGEKEPAREDQPDANEKAWSESDLKILRRLVGKHGSRAVSDAASKVVPRKPGRPPRGNLPYFEGMHLADWIDEQRAEHKRMGHSAPLKRAINDAYEMLYGDDPNRRDPEKYAKTVKRKLSRSRSDLEFQKKVAKEINAIGLRKIGREKIE
ncbi:hypothetical protein [Aquibium oceanicum]|uniref:hypothetical protein n=1 Tax=Aquibium oceanicum TaxID=1670800 RepID=UPI00361D866F